MSLILPKIYLAGFSEAIDVASRDKSVKLIINCTKDLPLIDFRPGIKHERMAIDDSYLAAHPHEIEAMYVFLTAGGGERLFNMIKECNGRVIFHCKAGKQRSAALLACYLLWCDRKLDPERVMAFIRHKRPIAFHFTAHFKPAIIAYYNHLQQLYAFNEK